MPAPAKVAAGQPIGATPIVSAAFQNDLIDVVKAYKLQELGNPTSGSGLASEPVKVQNLTGADRLRGHVVRIGAYLLNEDDPTRKWFEGNAVTTAFSPIFGILAKPLIANDIGPIFTAGDVCAAICDFTPVAGDGCGPKPGQSTLAKGFPGCIVIDVVDGPNKIAIVKILPPTLLHGRASGAISARADTTLGTGTMAIWAEIAGVLTDTTMTVAVKNFSAAITSGTYIKALWASSFWDVIYEDCDA